MTNTCNMSYRCAEDLSSARHSAAALFDRTALCSASMSRSSAQCDVQEHRRRALQARAADKPSSQVQAHAPLHVHPSQEQSAPWLQHDTAHRALRGDMASSSIIADDIQQWQHGNLQRSVVGQADQPWLGGYQPMRMSCPLFGRKVPKQTVSLFAAEAWRCDGLGFAYDCLTA